MARFLILPLFGILALSLSARTIVLSDEVKTGGNLEARIQGLESTVALLLQRVQHLEKQIGQTSSPTPTPVVYGKSYTCILKTPFDGSFSATAPTMMAAKANAMEKCNIATKNSVHCSSESNMKCGNE